LAAAIFFGATLALAFIGNRPASVTGGVMDNLPATTAPATAPAAPAPVPSAPAQGEGQSGQIPK
jgi:preprotein translocase subunit SecG